MTKKILLVYLPFCTPASPPYSITYLYSFLKNNSDCDVDVLDLNLEFHKLKFLDYQKYYNDTANWEDYDKTTSDYTRLTTVTYSKNNKKVVKGEKPEFFEELLQKIKDKKPDIVAFSIVYSSQAFYAYSLMKELEPACVIGGPAVNEKLMTVADESLKNEIELLSYINKKEVDHDKLNFDFALDFSIYDLNEYFTPKPVIPIKTSSTCYYKGCSFCTHFSKSKYFEFDLDIIKKTIVNSKQKHFFLIDDMISTPRLLKIAEVLKPLNVKYTCQLRPTKDLDYETLKKLRESGLTMIMWGVESGNDRVLKLINKGTNSKDISKVISDSHNAGIKNIVYMIFGFPTETKEEFLETIDFLNRNKKNIDLVSVSIFGLHKGTAIYNNPSNFGITKITEEQRTVLEPKIRYEVKTGLTQKQANQLRSNYKKTIEKINKYPKTMNYFREHMFCLI
ncbi:radical SAM protein [Candidatus Woesearchaeota archaeon]|nr:radical SAM protein [Candidatus Woesearchaeota archaeon]